MLAFLVVVAINITTKIFVTFSIFAKFADFYTAFFTFFFTNLNFSLLCYSCDIYQSDFLLKLKFLLLFRFLPTSSDFCKQFLLIMFLLHMLLQKLRQIFAGKFLLHLAILVKFLVLGIFSISSKYTFLKAVFFKYFWPKLPKIFASKFCDCLQSWTSHRCNLGHFGEVRYNMVQIGAVWFRLNKFGAKLV